VAAGSRNRGPDSRPGAADVSRLLAERIDSLVLDLLPGGRRFGNLWRAGSLAGEPGQSLAVHLAGAKRGRWNEFAGEEHGDALDLVVAVKGGGDFRRGIDWARHWLGIAELDVDEKRRRLDRAAESAAAERQRGSAEKAEHQRQAVAIWHESRPLAPGDPVDRYLQGRGIELARLGAAPRALRYHSGLWAAPGRWFPAMIGAVTDDNGAFLAVHRTFLEIQQGGRVGKAPVEINKRTLGPCAGGSVKLWRGAGRKGWRDMPRDEILLLSEGIEDLLAALTIAEIGLPRRPGAAASIVSAADLRGAVALSLSLMRALKLPRRVATVVILAQRDPEGSQAQRLLDQVVAGFRAEGRVVLTVAPPRWAGVKDVTDLARYFPAR
jgi:hypothetical protein